MRSLIIHEWKYFISRPSTYILAALFSAIVGIFFFLQLLSFQEILSQVTSQEQAVAAFLPTVVYPFFSQLNFFSLFLVPLMILNSFGAERSQGTMVLLQLSNLTDWEIVLGKYISLILQGIFFLLPLLIFPITMRFMGNFDYTSLWMGPLGLFFNWCLYLSIGLMAGILLSRPIMAAMVTFVVSFSFWIISMAGQAVQNLGLVQLLQQAGLAFHYETFLQGTLSLASVGYYLGFIIFFLWMTYQIWNQHESFS
jgi:ABC-2 type transport system permease protein